MCGACASVICGKTCTVLLLSAELYGGNKWFLFAANFANACMRAL